MPTLEEEFGQLSNEELGLASEFGELSPEELGMAQPAQPPVQATPSQPKQSYSESGLDLSNIPLSPTPMPPPASQTSDLQMSQQPADMSLLNNSVQDPFNQPSLEAQPSQDISYSFGADGMQIQQGAPMATPVDFPIPGSMKNVDMTTAPPKVIQGLKQQWEKYKEALDSNDDEKIAKWNNSPFSEYTYGSIKKQDVYAQTGDEGSLKNYLKMQKSAYANHGAIKAAIETIENPDSWMNHVAKGAIDLAVKTATIPVIGGAEYMMKNGSSIGSRAMAMWNSTVASDEAQIQYALETNPKAKRGTLDGVDGIWDEGVFYKPNSISPIASEALFWLLGSKLSPVKKVAEYGSGAFGVTKTYLGNLAREMAFAFGMGTVYEGVQATSAEEFQIKDPAIQSLLIPGFDALGVTLKGIAKGGIGMAHTAQNVASSVASKVDSSFGADIAKHFPKYIKPFFNKKTYKYMREIIKEDPSTYFNNIIRVLDARDELARSTGVPIESIPLNFAQTSGSPVASTIQNFLLSHGDVALRRQIEKADKNLIKVFDALVEKTHGININKQPLAAMVQGSNDIINLMEDTFTHTLGVEYANAIGAGKQIDVSGLHAKILQLIKEETKENYKTVESETLEKVIDYMTQYNKVAREVPITGKTAITGKGGADKESSIDLITGAGSSGEKQVGSSQYKTVSGTKVDPITGKEITETVFDTVPSTTFTNPYQLHVSYKKVVSTLAKLMYTTGGKTEQARLLSKVVPLIKDVVDDSMSHMPQVRDAYHKGMLEIENLAQGIIGKSRVEGDELFKVNQFIYDKNWVNSSGILPEWTKAMELYKKHIPETLKDMNAVQLNNKFTKIREALDSYGKESSAAELFGLMNKNNQENILIKHNMKAYGETGKAKNAEIFDNYLELLFNTKLSRMGSPTTEKLSILDNFGVTITGSSGTFIGRNMDAMAKTLTKTRNMEALSKILTAPESEYFPAVAKIFRESLHHPKTRPANAEKLEMVLGSFIDKDEKFRSNKGDLKKQFEEYEKGRAARKASLPSYVPL